MSAGVRRLLAGRDPWPAVLAVVALVVYLVHGVLGAISRDLSLYVYAGQQVLDGHAPYVAILNRAGPLAHLVPALGIALGRVVGLSDPVGARLLFLIVAVAAVVAVYFWCRLVLRSRSAALVGAAALLCSHGFIQYASDGPREKTVMVLLFVLFLIDLHKRHWFRAGVWLALATLTLQIIFPPGAGAALVALVLIGRGSRLRAVARFAGGGLVVVAAFVAYFAAMGALDDAFQAFWVINSRYTEADPPLENARAIWENVADAYGASLWVSVTGGVVVLLAGLLALAGWRRPGSDPAVARLRAVAPAAAAVVLWAVWSLRDFDGWPDAFPLLAPAALGIALLVVVIAERLALRAAMALVAACSLLAVADGFGYAVSSRDNLLVDQQALAEAIVRPLPRGATFFTVEAPQVVALTRNTLISRNVMYSAGLEVYLQDTYPGGLEGLGRWVTRQHPTLILITRDRSRFPTWLESTLARDYVAIRTPFMLTYLARSAGKKVRREVIRRVARAIENHPDLGDPTTYRYVS